MRPLPFSPLGLILVPLVAAAQEGPSIFTAVNNQDRVIASGVSRAGSLASSDLLLTSGRRVQVWSLAAEPGTDLQVDMRSPDFDTYLYVVGPGLGSGVEDDDGGDGLNSRLCFSVSEPQGYRVVAAALGSDVGDFTLSVAEAGSGCGTTTDGGMDVDLATLPTEGRTLSIGQTVAGRLTSSDPTSFGSPVQAWEVQGSPGQPFSVDLVSPDFDAFLTVIGPGLDEWLSDDDGAGGCDSRVTFTFPESGTYRVVVSTLGTGTGEFMLVASEEPGPESPESCIPSFDDFSAEEGELDEVPPSGELAIEDYVLGTMTDADMMVGGRGVQAWTLEARAGQRLAIDLVSEAFDSYVSFRGPGFPSTVSDDDGGEGLNSRLCVLIPESATYRVFAGPLSGASIGSSYRLSVRSQEVEEFCDRFEMSPAALASAMAEISTEGRSLEVGFEVESSLAYGETTHPETGQSIQPWSLQVPAGQSVTVDVVSYAFDPVLYIAGAGLAEVLYNDDGDGPGCQSRITFELDEGGAATLMPGALYDGGSGPFLLRASTDPGPLEDGGCTGSGAATGDVGALDGLSALPEGELEIGMEVDGVLAEGSEVLPSGSWGQVWTFSGTAGERVAISLSAEDFDTYLYLDGPGLGAPMVDDDGGSDTNSRLELVLPESGQYRVVASAYSEGNGGAYRLYVARRAR